MHRVAVVRGGRFLHVGSGIGLHNGCFLIPRVRRRRIVADLVVIRGGHCRRERKVSSPECDSLSFHLEKNLLPSAEQHFGPPLQLLWLVLPRRVNCKWPWETPKHEPHARLCLRAARAHLLYQGVWNIFFMIIASPFRAALGLARACCSERSGRAWLGRGPWR